MCVVGDPKSTACPVKYLHLIQVRQSSTLHCQSFSNALRTENTVTKHRFFLTQEALWEQDSAAEEGLHLNPIPLRRPFCSTGAFRNKRLIIEANVTSNGGGQRAWSLHSGERILFEGDIFTGYPWNRRLWLRKVPCVYPSPSWSHRKRNMLCTLHIPILIIFFVLQIQSFMVKGASIDVLWWVIQTESTHTHTHTKES